ncbi:MobQ family relaxase [Pseudoluteimonas lycopersici]|uniref:MobQ family relaxase n=1 Tax=Pseudoluteimonas lycopersici TaxID=1324796 RepID=UPI00163DC720|nr:MobQ family relaxase [Lysobacter lycopersici]
MSIFHLSAQVIGRSSGRSSTAAAAYRAATRILDERTGEVHDFTHKGGVRESFILAPDTAAPWMHERDALWNGVERIEKRKDAQLAREIEVSLPHELSHERRRRLLIDYVIDEFVSRGMVADVAMHQPGKTGDRRNEHAHILLTLRHIDGNDFGSKAREWNDKDLIEKWRESWARRVNLALKEGAVSARVDHRSYKRQMLAQGINVELAPLATVHLGPQASTLERRGTRTAPGNLNREVAVINLELERIRCQARTPSEDPVSADPVSWHSDRMAQRYGKLRQQLRDVLGLSHLPAAEESRAEIARRRNDLPFIRALYLKKSKPLQMAILHMDEAKEGVSKIKRRINLLEEEGRELRRQARQCSAVLQWRQVHSLRSWLHDLGLLKTPAAQLIAAPELLQRQWEEARQAFGRLQSELQVAQMRQESAVQAWSKMLATVEDEAHQESAKSAWRVDNAASLADELQQVEASLRQQREASAPTLDSDNYDVHLGSGPTP